MALQAIKTSPILSSDNTRYALEQSKSKSNDDYDNIDALPKFQPKLQRQATSNWKDYHRDLADGGFRGAIFGFSDGLATNLCLVIGVQVALSVNSPYHIIMTGIAGLLAGGMLTVDTMYTLLLDCPISVHS